MKSYLKVLSLAAVLGASYMGAAQASVYVWHDASQNVSASFPDSWKSISNQGADDVLTVQAPGAGHDATCRISATQDDRFKIYPIAYSANIQRVALNEEFWGQSFAHVNEPVFYQIEDNKGLGRGLRLWRL